MRGCKESRNWRGPKRLRMAVFLTFLPIAVWNQVGHLRAEEFQVGTGVELQEALDIADNNGENDLIVLAAATYSGNFVYKPMDGRAISIRGDDGTRSADVVLDGSGSGQVLALSASATGGTVRLEGLTIQGGEIRGLSIEGEEGTIKVFLKHLIVQDNLSTTHGAGIYVRLWGNATVTMEIWDSVVRHNQAAKRGGGIFAEAHGGDSSVDLLLVNVLIHGNQANWCGGGLNVTASEVEDGNEARAVLLHSTITGNVCDIERSGAEFGGGVRVYAYNGNGAQATLDLYNTILYGNYALGGDEPQDLYVGERSPGEAVVRADSCDIGIAKLGDGLPTYTATEVISADPVFVNPVAHNYHLSVSSPCRDIGTSAVPDPPGLPPHDFEGQRRVMGKAPDIGADEFGIGFCPPLLLDD